MYNIGLAEITSSALNHFPRFNFCLLIEKDILWDGKKFLGFEAPNLVAEGAKFGTVLVASLDEQDLAPVRARLRHGRWVAGICFYV